ncbi:hypothetical protein H9Q69_001312 [Fusarium xylarioides]|uniref:Uncharacterized protein n=1 Tax=Fusarium xylarioides TaxID=221167 RepID=A0A9P7I7M4_9HYPO|nr:hypothetical protein H9Q70_007265 [Fusarium xylarioides]KAG5769965.1 hypothetical protein H9Q72_002960 [Fusarium xylarioides]KAG5778832.1 hypothetical protein H9Q73_007502 [Fusarium xylarioides]KAG5799682.1 hypothetical protein H9Q69_001312 [Fusarium xylarioides]
MDFWALHDLLGDLDNFIEEPSDESIFAHLKFGAAAGNIFEIPSGLFERRLEYDTKLVVVVAESKKAMMDKNLMPRVGAIVRDALHTGQPVRSDVAVYTYSELFTLLKSFRDPQFWNQASQNFCFPFTTFMVDVDPDFSAEFVLALNAATIFTKTFNDNQQNPNTTVRLITMSSEHIHPFILKLFQRFHAIQFFELPAIEDNYAPEHVYSSDMKKALRKIRKWIREYGRNRKNTIITFCGEDLMPDEWRRDPYIKNLRQVQVIHPGILNIIQSSNEDMLVSFPETFETDFKLDISGNVHIVGSLVRRRRILDRQTGHEVEATLMLSKREREAQISAASWFEIDDTFIRFYSPHDYLTSPHVDFSRRMKFACEQIEGFVAAWTDLGNWPDETFDILSHILNVEDAMANDIALPPGTIPSATADEDSIDYYNINSALDRTRKRLQLQGLIGLNYTFGTAIPANRERFFHDLNQITTYIGKAAHATALESTPKLSQLKMHLLAALWAGMKRLIQVDWRDNNGNVNQEVRSLIGFSSTAAIARYGTLWSKLGLMEALWAKHASGFCPNSTASHIIDGRISASTLARSTWMSYRQNISALAARENIAMPSVDGFFLRDFEIREDEYDQLCRNFMQVYSNQVAIVTKRGDVLKINDFASGERLDYTADVLNLVDWTYIIRQEQDSPVLGFYTAASRVSRRTRTEISDWNWIPTRLWQEWGQTLQNAAQVGTEAFKTHGATGRLRRVHRSHRNPDEV